MFNIQSCKNKWPLRFLNLIYKALELKRCMLLAPSSNYKSQIKKIKEDSVTLTNQKLKGPKSLNALIKRLTKNINSLWVFLDHLEVPPDNNGSERAIRNIRIKQKVSG